jgi:L-histidine Nalpha-methyltransferase
LGGTIGNLNPTQRARFLFDLNCTMSSDDSVLIGTDLVKDRSRLVAAYDDAAGVTADFNRNVLHVLNDQLGGDFDPDRFRHVALWNEDEQWIEMRLRADEASEVSLTEAGITVQFDQDEDLLTEISAKFTPERVERELSDAGFVAEGMWGAEDGEFLLTLAHPFC